MIAVLIATGSSVTPEQVEYVKGKARIYVINSSYKLAPWADVLYACDEEWWDYYKPEFAGEKWTLNESAAQKYGLNLIKYDPSLVFSTDDGLIATGHNSGFQALNLAYLQGARTNILIWSISWRNEQIPKHEAMDSPHGKGRANYCQTWGRSH